MKNLFLLFLISIAFLQCKKAEILIDKTVQTKNIIDMYLELTDPKLDASIVLTNYQANFGINGEENEYITIGCVPEQPICDYRKVYLNNEVFDIDEGSERTMYDMDKFFGKELTVQFGEPNISRDENTTSFYIPEQLEVTMPDEVFLGESYTITWNADTNNEDGLYIIVQYTAFENENFKESHPDRITNYINIPDNGTYTFSPSDFPEIPEGTIVVLTLIRGSYITGEIQSEEDFRVIAKSHVSGYVKFN